jgi:hypothetical protein
MNSSSKQESNKGPGKREKFSLDISWKLLWLDYPNNPNQKHMMITLKLLRVD